MGKKDLTQKSLESFPDVFADCVNALLYQGTLHLLPEVLQPAPTESLYPDEASELHNQFQDISKYEMLEGKIKTQYTIENQTQPDKRMILRKAGYEGAIYRTQYDNADFYPVISIVLYWGKRRWNYPRKLKKLAKKLLTADELRYVDDVHLHVFDMAYLPPEIRQRFRSDMRIVVDYLAEGKDYVPTTQKINHPEALLRLLQALSGDKRFGEIWQMLQKTNETEDVNMCELLDKYWNGGVAQGKSEGIAIGRTEGIAVGKAENNVNTVRSMYKHKMSAEAIAELISQSLETINRIISLFLQYPEEDDLSIAKRLLAKQ